MQNNIPTFIISQSKEADFLNHIYASEQFIRNANVIVLHEIRVFKLLYDFFDLNFKFRLMIHPSLSGNSELKQSDYTYLEKQLLTLKQSKEFVKMDVPFITRNLNIKKLCNEHGTNFVEHDGYTFFDARRIDIDDFENDIPVFTKTKAKDGNTFVHKNETNAGCLVEEIDFAIVTALYYDELQEVKFAFNIDSSNEFKFGNNVGFKFNFNGKNIIAVSQHQMGMVDSAILSTELMIKFNPKYIIMPGVCGGDDETNFGDIIMSKKVHLFQTGKMTNEGNEIESVEVKIDEATSKQIEQNESEIVEEIQAEILNIIENGAAKQKKMFKPFKRNNLKFYLKPTACSTMVIDKDGFFAELKKNIDRKMIGIEMEGYGMARASEYIKNRTKSIMIKCVMDKTTNKEDLAKAYAAYVSAQFVKKLIEKNILE